MVYLALLSAMEESALVYLYWFVFTRVLVCLTLTGLSDPILHQSIQVSQRLFAI